MPYGRPDADEVAPRGTKAWRQAVNANRRFVADSLWKMHAQGQLDLTDPQAMSRALISLGVTPEKGGGRHMYNLFLGQLPSEGFGMSTVPGREGMGYAMEAYMPDWKWNFDRARQGGHLTWDRGAGMYFNDPGNNPAQRQWYDQSFGLPTQGPSQAQTSIAASPWYDDDELERFGLGG